MKDTLKPGLTSSEIHEVTADLSARHLPDIVVLSTPSMIELLEMTSHRLVALHLDDNETTVGTHVEISHVAAAPGGDHVTVTSTLVGVRKNRLTFELAVHSGEKLIGEGTHQRAVIDTTRFA